MAPSRREFHTRAFARNANGERLSGYGGIVWEASGGASVTALEPRASDRVRITAAWTDSFDISFSTGESVRVDVVEESDVATLKIAYCQDDGNPSLVEAGGALLLEANSVSILHLVARTDDGRYISGPGAEFASVQMSASMEGALEDILATLVADLEGAEERDANWARRFFERGFVFQATGEPEATGTLAFAWAGQVLDINVEIRATQGSPVAPDADE